MRFFTSLFLSLLLSGHALADQNDVIKPSATIVATIPLGDKNETFFVPLGEEVTYTHVNSVRLTLTIKDGRATAVYGSPHNPNLTLTGEVTTCHSHMGSPLRIAWEVENISSSRSWNYRILKVNSAAHYACLVLDSVLLRPASD
jgi:hypothetical protein